MFTKMLISYVDSLVLFCVDGIDGKQARRTNSSTPLGELFDHGLDSWACIFFVATVYSIFGRGESGVGVTTLYYILWVVLFSFILSHWEKYNTGILFLPWGYDISQVVRMHTNTLKKCTACSFIYSMHGVFLWSTQSHTLLKICWKNTLGNMIVTHMSATWVQIDFLTISVPKYWNSNYK